MNSNLQVEIERNSVPQPEDETPAVDGRQSITINDPKSVSAGQRCAETQSTSGRWRRLLPWVPRVEVVVLCVVIALAWCLLALPIVFYYLPNDTALGSSGGFTCELTNSTRYTGTACREPLQSCLNTSGASDVYVSLTVDDQAEAEQTAMLIEFGLDQLQASDECKQAALPFMCLYLFGLCDSNGTLHSPSAMDCLHISTELCAVEWAVGQSQLDLPECSTLPKQFSVSSCISSSSIPGNTTTSSNSISPPTNSTASCPNGNSPSMCVVMGTNCTVNCSDSFYCTTNNTCRPRCGSWKELSQASSVALDTAVIISFSMGVIAGAMVFIITCIKRKNLLVFPALLIQYRTATVVILGSVGLISYLDRTGLFCSSIDLQISIENSTPFCTFAGMIFYYTLLQLSILTIFHVAILYWNVQFPFHSRNFKLAGRMKYLHIAMVVIALLVPVIPVVAEVTAGRFAITRFPSILCTGTSPEATFYALVVPIVVILQVSVTMLIIIFWIIRKQQTKLSTVEKKILIIFCYYVVLGVIALTTFSLFQRNLQDLTRNVLLYFACELNGINPNCDRSTFEELAYPEIIAVSFVLLGLYPAVNIIYVITVKEVSQFCRRCTHLIASSSTDTAGVTSQVFSSRTGTSPL